MIARDREGTTEGMRTAGTAITIAIMAVVTAITLLVVPFYTASIQGVTLVTFTIVVWALFALAVFLLRKVPTRAAVILILVGSAVIGGAAMVGPPNTSTDPARYAWDGIVQNAGISPYTYAPTSKNLERLRPGWLFESPTVAADGTAICKGVRFHLYSVPDTHERTATGDDEQICTAINRAQGKTIYPPSSEILFAAVRFVTGPTAEYWPLQLVGLLISTGISAMLLLGLHARKLDLRWAALWAWCPLVASQAVTNSHVDVLGAVLLLAATLLVSTRRRWLGGIALGASIASKLIPVIGAPALLRRQPWKIVIAAVGTFLLLYLPYVLASGVKVLGYLPTYLTQEGYGNGSRFALIIPFAQGNGAIIVALILLLALAILVWRKTDPHTPWVGQLAMIGGAFLIISPSYPWYLLLLVPMIAMSGRWEWLALPLAFMAHSLQPTTAVAQWGELTALVIVVAGSLIRSGPGAFGRVLHEARHPLS